MTRCSKCRYGNLVKIAETGRTEKDWMFECNALNEPEYITLDYAELEQLPCDLYDDNCNDDTTA